ncbi:MAG: hypothetical protein KF862_20360 [Chitinophagaceae bacterium]|nr:hypothetical protein [Chitinophagaceae bacterium]
MELDELKKIWKQSGAERGMGPGSDAELLSMLGERSKSPLAKMRRNLFFELVVVLASVTTVALYYFTAFEGKLKEISWVYIAIAVLFVWYYYKKNKLLKSMQCAACRVKRNLELQLKTLDKYVKLYLVTGIALFPIILYILLYLVLGYNKTAILALFKLESDENLFIILYTLFTVIFTVVMYFVNKWYIHLLYGRHIKKLKSLISEMEETE